MIDTVLLPVQRWRHFLVAFLLLLLSFSSLAEYTQSTIAQTAFDSTATAVVWQNINTSFPNDDDQQVVNLGFNFDFGGVSYNQVRIISNGFLQFGVDQSVHQIYNNVELPVASADRLVVPYWDDLNPNAGGSVTYGTFGTAPNRRFAATWSSVPRFGSTTLLYSFQVVLYENGNILFRYGNDAADGASATIGIEESDSDFNQFSENTVSVSDAQDLLWQPVSVGGGGPVAEWRFDEALWDGSAGQVEDSAGGNNASSVSPANTISGGLVCRAGDLSANSSTDRVNVPNGVLDGVNDFTISIWGQTTIGGQQTLFSGSDGSQHNELIMFFSNTTTFTPFIMGSGSGSISIPNIADGDWHHMVWTREGAQNCFYFDAVLQGCTNRGTGPIDITSSGLVLGQEQDGLNGGFSSSQDWGGLLDEVLIFHEAISVTEIASIYTNQQAGNNWDGSSRTCPVVNINTDPVVEWRFDEVSWNGSVGQVLDSVGGEHATSAGAANTLAAGQVCRAGDFSANSNTDRVILPNTAMDGLNNFSVSVWGRSSTTGTQTILSGSDGSQHNELIMFFPNSTTFTPYIMGSGGGNISIVDIADGNWHHFVWTREGATNCIYIDGVLQGCSNKGTGAIDITANGLVVGQEQDSLGGGFDGNQDWEGELDELLIFEAALSATDITTGYANQLAGNGWDGSARTCPVIDNKNFILSAENDATLGGLTFADEDLAEYDSGADIATQIFDGSSIFGSDTDIHAVHVLESGRILFSTNNDNTIGTFGFENEDIVEYNPVDGTARLYLNGDQVFAQEENIDAISIRDNGNILLSTTGNAVINGLSFADEDVVEYNPATGIAILLFDGSAIIGGGGTDVDAFHWLDNGNYVFSINNNNRSIGGVSFNDGDLVEYDPVAGSASIYFQENRFVANEDIKAVYVGEIIPLPAPLADYRYDETIWNGSAGEVADNTGNGFDGTALGSAVAEPIPVLPASAIASNPGTCGYGSFPLNTSAGVIDAVDTGIDVDADVGSSGTITLWYNSNSNWAGGGNRSLFDAAENAGQKYFFLTLLGNGQLRFGLEDSSDGDFRFNSPLQPFTAGQWAHISVSWDLPNDSFKMYVNGVEVATYSPNTNGVIGDMANLLVGDNNGDYILNNDTTPNSANGLIDEFRVYSSALTIDQVNAVMSDVHPCSSANNLVLATDSNAGLGGITFGDEDLVEYNAGTDTATRIFDGTAVLNTDSDIEAIHILDNGNYLLVTEQNRSIGGLAFEHEDVVEYNPSSGVATVFLDGDLVFNQEEQIDAFSILGSGNYLLSTSGNAAIGGLSFNDEDLVEYDPSTGTATLFLDASVVAPTINDIKGVHALENGNLLLTFNIDNRSIGGLTGIADGDVIEYNPNTNVATQYLDESRFDGNEDIRALFLYESSAAGADHIEIQVSSTASTCTPKDVTINICADAACSSYFTGYLGSVDLSTLTGHGNWQNGASILNSDDSGNAIYTFTASDSGSVTLQLSNSHAESLTITATDTTNASLTGTSGTVTFSDNAFVISDVDAIPGGDVAIAGRDHNFRVDMVKRDINGDCGIATEYNNGSQPVKAWVQRSDIAASNAPALLTPAAVSTSLPGSQASAATISLDFSGGAGGSAFFSLQTTDVGLFSIEMLDDFDGFATDLDIRGSSNTLVVRPFGVDIDFVVGGVNDRGSNGTGGVSYAAGPGDSPYIASGSGIEIIVSAVQWQASDDIDANGIPDAGADLTDNALTPNFGQEAAAEIIVLSHSLVLPSPGTQGVLSGASFSAFTAGVSQHSNTSWSEVGIIDLFAALGDGDYLGSGQDVPGAVSNVGRFVPAHFRLAGGVVTEACISGGFTYMQQNFDLDYDLIAENASNNTTLNYHNDFARLDGSLGSVDVGAVDLLKVENLTSRLSHTGLDFADATNFSWVNGTGSLTTTLQLDRLTAPAYDGAFTMSSGIQVADADGVAIASAYLDLDVGGGSNEYALVGDSVQRYGRVVLENAVGSELRNLDIPFVAQYFESTAAAGAGAFIPNTDDQCSQYIVGDFSAVPGSYTQMLNAIDTSPIAPSTLTDYDSGTGAVTLSAPGTGNYGSVDIEFSVPLHLQFDWDANPTTADENPTSTATFGSFRGNDRIIYRREVIQ